MCESDVLIFLQASYQDSDLGLDEADPVGNWILKSRHINLFIKSVTAQALWMQCARYYQGSSYQSCDSAWVYSPFEVLLLSGRTC